VGGEGDPGGGGKALIAHNLEVGWDGLPSMPMYAEYVEGLAGELERVPAEVRTSSASYAAYLSGLVAYLADFYGRIHPLSDGDGFLRRSVRAFRRRWRMRHVHGNDPAERTTFLGVVVVGLEGFETAEAMLEGVGGARVRAVLGDLGMKCGGSARDAALRLWGVRNVLRSHVKDRGVFKSGKADKAGKRRGRARRLNVAHDALSGSQHAEERVACLELQVRILTDFLSPQLQAAAEHARGRVGQTGRDLAAEVDAQERELALAAGFEVPPVPDAAAPGDGGGELDAGETQTRERVYLDVDGRPIPKWLWKVKGLHQTFPCQICGGAKFQGKKAWEAHFGKPQHTSALRRLGITYSKALDLIDKVADAHRIWEKLQRKASAVLHVPQQAMDVL